tara:strand:- start:233 stop:1081 length:849 start_codon:yes stop_codon:yes gene_type:complete
LSKLVQAPAHFDRANNTDLLIRPSHEGDTPQIMAFHRDNPNQYVDPLTEERISEIAAQQRIMLVTSISGQILGTTVAYPYLCHVNRSDDGWIEAGAVRSTVNGVGKLMTGSQILQQFINSPPQHGFFTNIYAENEDATAFFSKAGWRLLDEVPEGIQRSYGDVQGYTLDEMNTWTWMEFPISSLPNLARKVLDTLSTGQAMNSKTGQSVNIELSNQLPFHCPEGRAILEIVGNGDIAAKLESDGDHMSWSEARELITSHLEQVLVTDVPSLEDYDSSVEHQV